MAASFKKQMVGVLGFKPRTSPSQAERSDQAELHPETYFPEDPLRGSPEAKPGESANRFIRPSHRLKKESFRALRCALIVSFVFAIKIKKPDPLSRTGPVCFRCFTVR